MTRQPMRPSRMWETAQAGGCARKLSPALVEAVAPWLPAAGGHFMEDAAVVSVGRLRIVHSVDVITPLVPDVQDFGRIAAANAMSDVFVSGAWPVSALAIACVPPDEGVREIAGALAAARAHLMQSNCELVGGHSLVDPEAKLGFAVVGALTDRGSLATGARAGDAIILTKPLGVGIVTSAYRVGAAADEILTSAIETMTATNSCVPRLQESDLGGALHAATDVTGYGLLGHLFEFCRRNDVGVSLRLKDIPAIPGARELASAGICTSAFAANVEYVRPACRFDVASLDLADQLILTDPQTSGGALIAVEQQWASDVLALLADWGVAAAQVGQSTAEEGIDLA